MLIITVFGYERKPQGSFNGLLENEIVSYDSFNNDFATLSAKILIQNMPIPVF